MLRLVLGGQLLSPFVLVGVKLKIIALDMRNCKISRMAIAPGPEFSRKSQTLTFGINILIYKKRIGTLKNFNDAAAGEIMLIMVA